MKKIILSSALVLLSLPVFPGESVGLIENFKGSIENISLNRGVSPITRASLDRALESVQPYIEYSDPKLSQKFVPVRDAARVLSNSVQIAFNKFIAPFKKMVENGDLFATVDQKLIKGIEESIQPLRSELKKIKGSFLSGFSLGKKSEAQKLIDGVRDALVKKMEEIIKEFEAIKKTKQIKGLNEFNL